MTSLMSSSSPLGLVPRSTGPGGDASPAAVRAYPGAPRPAAGPPAGFSPVAGRVNARSGQALSPPEPPAAGAVPLCPACGQVIPQRDDCATPVPGGVCGHGRVMHRFGNSQTAVKGPRRACSVGTAKGRCPCQRYTPAEAAGE